MATPLDILARQKQGGRRIIGCFPLYPPLELFHSLGLLPVVLWGLRETVRRVPDADRHIQGYACSVARHLVQFVIGEGGALFGGLFHYNACDTLRNLPEIMAEGRKEAGADPLPTFRMHLPMVPAHQTDASAYFKDEVQTLIDALEEAFEVRFSEDRFAESVALYARLRTLTRRLEKAVAAGRTSFADFCETLALANFLPVEEQIQLMESNLAQAGSHHAAPPAAGRVIVSGILPPPAGICRMMDQAGLRAAGNDIAAFFRSYAHTPDAWKDAPDYYARFYQDHFPCTTLLYAADRRVDAVIDLAVNRQAEGLIFVGEKFCEYEYFELPYLEGRLKEAGISVLALEISMEDDANAEAFRTRMEAFGEFLTRRKTRSAREK